MELLTYSLILLIAVVISSVVQQLFPKLPLSLVQIGLGVIIAIFASGSIDSSFDSELFLVLFIAPLLYNEAYEFNISSLWRQMRTIFVYAIGLVVIITLVVGFSVNALFASVPLAASLALGAALGPTDAVAVSSISKNFKIDKRITNILGGEALFNDASGLVAFQFAILFLVSGSFSPLEATEYFLYVFFIGLIVGLVCGYTFNKVKDWICNIGYEETTFHVIFSITKPFIVFLLAEHIGASGIIAVVACGLMCGRAKRTSGPSMSRSNILTNSMWEVITFILNCIVFVLLGMQLPSILFMDYTVEYKLSLVLLVFAIVLVMLLVRFVLSIVVCKVNKIENIGKSSALMTLLGAKGTVTLSIMFTIPTTIALADSSVIDFPFRSELIFIAACVILLTLLLANFVAPLFTEKEEIQEDLLNKDIEANLEILRCVIEELTDRQTSENHMATRQVVIAYNDRIDRIKNQNNLEYNKDHEREIRVKACDWQLEYLKTEEAKNSYDEDTIQRVHSNIKSTKKILSSDHMIISEIVYQWQDLVEKISTFLYKIATRAPLINPTEGVDNRYSLLCDSYKYALGKLEEFIVGNDMDAEYISNVIVDYQRFFRMTQSKLPSVSSMVKIDNKADDIERLALKLEMKYVNEFLKDEKISKKYANELKDDINMMLVDLNF